MYNTDLAKDDLYAFILQNTTEYDIYCYYIGSTVKLNSIFSSPLRLDKNPSFGIFKSRTTGELLFKDQATGESGNCIKFVMLLNNMTYKQALKDIYKNVIKETITRSVKGIEVQHTAEQKTSILVKRKYFTQTDDIYWNQYGITREDLKLYNVFPIEYYWVNGELQSHVYGQNNPMYVYHIYDRCKIYRPYADKKNKWRTNATRHDIQGLEQLKYDAKTVIITKSLKDVIVLNKLGYNAIAPNGENHTVPKVVIERLINHYNTTEFIVLYDNDIPGVTAAAKLLEKYADYNIRSYILPVESLCKDISDYVKMYGMEKAKEWMRTIITN